MPAFLPQGVSSAEFVNDRYAVHMMPIVDTKGWQMGQNTNRSTKERGEQLTIWKGKGMTRKLRICTAGQTIQLALSAGR